MLIFSRFDITVIVKINDVKSIICVLIDDLVIREITCIPSPADDAAMSIAGQICDMYFRKLNTTK